MERRLTWSFPSGQVYVRTISQRTTVTFCLPGGCWFLYFVKDFLSWNHVLQFIMCEIGLFWRSVFFLGFLHLWKESQEEKHKRSENTYYSQYDSARNREARKESKIQISQEVGEGRGQERSFMSCREVRISHLFIDLMKTWKGELQSWKQQMPKDALQAYQIQPISHNLALNGGSFWLRELRATHWQ